MTADQQEGESGRRQRSVREIERSMDVRTERLSKNVDELVSRMKPARLVRGAAQQAGSGLTTPSGAPRLEVWGAVAGAVLVAGFLIWRARRGRN